ncbi:hypothetical protein ACHAWF_004584 [Thalassiosira exigua]
MASFGSFALVCCIELTHLQLFLPQRRGQTWVTTQSTRKSSYSAARSAAPTSAFIPLPIAAGAPESSGSAASRPSTAASLAPHAFLAAAAARPSNVTDAPPSMPRGTAAASWSLQHSPATTRFPWQYP